MTFTGELFVHLPRNLVESVKLMDTGKGIRAASILYVLKSYMDLDPIESD